MIPTLDDVPYYLMPVAAALGYYVVVAALRVLYLVLYKSSNDNVGETPRSTSTSGTSSASTTSSKNVQFYLTTVVFALITYTYIVGWIDGTYEKVQHASFDPYGVLNLTQTQASNTTTLNAVYKFKVQHYHPSNKETGDATELRQVLLAYQALTEDEQKRNFEKFGHPEGQILTSMFQFTIPAWLYRHNERVKGSMLAAYVVMTVALLCTFLRLRHDDKQRRKRMEMDDHDFTFTSNSVQDIDVHHMAQYIRPDMSRWDVLQLVVSVPTNIMWCTRDLQRIDKIRLQRMEQMSKQSKRASIMNFDSIVDEGGWADDDGDGDDDDDTNEDDMDLGEKQALAAAKRAEEERRKQFEMLQKATGKSTELLEDLDKEKGVLGQKWVERTLESAGHWPPKDLDFLESMKTSASSGTTTTTTTFAEYNGKRVSKPFDHPAVHRMLCMICGRLNSQMLNSHPELLDAGSKKLIDQTYFQSSMLFRQRVGLLLEALVTIATQLKSYRLLKTCVDVATIFKVGCDVDESSDPDTAKWFKDVCQKQYGCTPALKIHSSSISTPDYDDGIATCDEPQLVLEMERTHAENFLRTKIAQCQKQGIPPQVALQNYREGWFGMIRCERLDGGKGNKSAMKKLELKEENLKDLQMGKKTISLFEKEDPVYYLMAGFPMIVGNVSQKNLKCQISFDAPPTAGKYKFYVVFKSLEFIGCDVEETFEVDIKNAKDVKRNKKEKKKKKDDDNKEPKKTK